MTATLAATGLRDGISSQLDYESQYVSFWIEDQLIGVPVNAVQEVLNPQTIAPTPLARPEIAGLLNLRGQIVTAVNLRRRLGLADRPDGQPSMNVVVRFRGESYSLLVDEVGDVINVSGLDLEPTPRTVDGVWKAFTAGVFRLEQRLFVILDVAALLTFD
jgi:purine-binding chemotaxis protein CheW